MIEALDVRDHVIVCGINSTSLHIIEELESYKQKAANAPADSSRTPARDYVVIERSEENAAKLLAKIPGLKYVVADATDDEALEGANIQEAYGIFPILRSEKDNVYITITARQMNPKIRIVSGTTDLFSIGQKLFQAGASAVISPNFIGGLRLVSELIRPNVTELLDQMLRSKHSDLGIREVPVSENSELCGKTLREAAIPDKTGLVLIAITKKGSSQYVYNPGAGAKIDEGDILVALGGRAEIDGLRKLAQG